LDRTLKRAYAAMAFFFLLQPDTDRRFGNKARQLKKLEKDPYFPGIDFVITWLRSEWRSRCDHHRQSEHADDSWGIKQSRVRDDHRSSG
jgi:hypothetical protein